MGLLYKWENQLDSARIWFEEASFEAVTKQDSVRAASELLLLPSLDHDHDKVIVGVEGSLEKIKDSGDVKTVVTVMYGLAKSYHQVGRSKEAIAMLEACLGFCGDESTNIWLKSIVLEELKTITTNLRDYKKCCEIQAVLDSVNATFNLEEQLKMVNSMQLQHEYAEAEAQAQYERDMERIRETRKSVITYFIIAVLLLAIILSLIMLSRKNIVLKAKQAEKERLSDELEGKKQELVSKLLSQTKANDTLNEVKEQLASMEGMKEEDRADILVKTVRKINEVINANSDDNLDFYFLQVHPKFYDNLRRDFPDLTLGELRLCALIKLNMNTKDIASINNITINGVKVARWRLRKKLGMNDANDNLSDFLANY
jgi:tetratricopeptide (TPR) repeat protein